MFGIRRIKRIIRYKRNEENDIEEWNEYAIDEIDIYNWEGFVNGPEDSPYEFYSY